MKYTVLLVDDDGDDRLFFHDAVKNASPEVSCITLEDGNALITLLREKAVQPDLIFLDINMPCINGWECLAALRDNEHYSNTPAIIYSTTNNKEEISKAEAEGATGFFTKPSDITVLRERVKKVIDFMLQGKLHELQQNRDFFR